MNFRAVPVFLVFLLMGVADAMAPLSSQVSQNLKMAALMPFFVFTAFAVFSVPGGVMSARLGKKRTLLFGLTLCTAGVAVPTFFRPPLPLLLISITLLGAGTTLLQVAGNPIMRDVSPAGAYSRNLALAQGIKGVGSTASAFLVTAVTSITVFSTMGWRGAFPIFFALMVLALILVATLKIQETKAEAPSSISSSLTLLREPIFAQAVMGIFLYVGAEVCMATYLKPFMARFGMGERVAALTGPTVFFACLTLGRLVAAGLKIPASYFFRVSTGLGLAGLLCLTIGAKPLALPGVILSGLGFANIWPMLFSLTVETKPECASQLSGLMCMAISGGALLPLVMGQLGGGELSISFCVPLACFVYLSALSLMDWNVR
ncbi:sugar MFS transporter [Geothrix sp. PMB-07]|uniref:MFS transporter n=1 Tax=Geothrix sp. PMB-07 TaxID=3068640 RepID=UPI00274159F6|nr:MFS transporter [Geothrix sp. PMB-07]WLT30909.1 MFS transporter [Geothrix sp. PMB-07]